MISAGRWIYVSSRTARAVTQRNNCLKKNQMHDNDKIKIVKRMSPKKIQMVNTVNFVGLIAQTWLCQQSTAAICVV